MLPRYDYNFIISDFGDIRREAVRAYKECDIHLLCGASSRRFEVAEFADGLKAIKSAKPQILTYTPHSDCGEFFNSAVIGKPTIIKPVRDMLDFPKQTALSLSPKYTNGLFH